MTAGRFLALAVGGHAVTAHPYVTRGRDLYWTIRDDAGLRVGMVVKHGDGRRWLAVDNHGYRWGFHPSIRVAIAELMAEHTRPVLIERAS